MKTIIIILIMLTASTISGQELSPRAYWPAPNGTKLCILGYSHSWGDVLMDPSLPITGVDSRIHVGILAYQQTINFFGSTSKFVIEIPYVIGNLKGFLDGEPRTRNISGFSDIGLTLSANFIGAPSMTPSEFLELLNSPHPILGASVKILVPSGHYEKDRLINVGTNRWAIKPELGFMMPLNDKWLFELELGVWFFADNDEFLGVTRKQKPITATEIHIVRRFKPGFWAALDLNFYTGGKTIVNGKLNADLQRNSRFGITLVYPIARNQSLLAGFSKGVVTKSGEDFFSILLTYNLLLN